MPAFLGAMYSLVKCLPEILQFLQTLGKQIEEANTDRKIKDDLARINEAFEKRDASILNDVFNK